ncbi:hypothetical protein GA0115239_10631, partial [Streptomyces sp. BpilaLS-43]
RPAQQGPGPGRHQPPLRPLQRLLLAAARRDHGVLVRLLDRHRPGVRAGRRPARQAGADLPQARAGPGCPAARHRLRVGLPDAPRGGPPRGRGHRRHTVAAAGRPCARPGRGARPGTPRRGAPLRLPRRHRAARVPGRLRRRVHRGDGGARRRRRVPGFHRPAPLGAPAAGTRPGPADVPGRHGTRRGRVHRVVHRARHAHAPTRRDRRAARRGRSGGPPRRVDAGALRTDGRGLAPHPGGAQARVRGAGGRGDRAGVAALPGGRGARLRGRAHGRRPDPVRTSRRRRRVGDAGHRSRVARGSGRPPHRRSRGPCGERRRLGRIRVEPWRRGPAPRRPSCL